VTSEEVLSGLTTESVVIDSQVEVLRSEEIKMAVYKAIAPHVVLALLGTDKREPDEFERFAERLTAKRIGLSSVIEANVDGQDPQATSEVANRWAQVYVNSLLRQKEAAGRSAQNALADRVNDVRVRLVQADAALQDYRIRNGLLTKDPTALAEQQALTLNEARVDAQVQAAESQARAQGTARDDSLATTPEVLNSELIQKLREEEATAAAALSELRSRYDDAHPLVIRKVSELSQVREQVSREQVRIGGSLRREAQTRQSQYAGLNQSYQQSLRSLEVRNRALTRLTELQSNVESLRTLYQATLSRYNDVNMQAGLGLPDARVISRASMPVRPSSPNVPLIFVLTIVLASGAFLFTVVVTSFLAGQTKI
jgi:uncharacterized protein involved in exopolysaccharide biosynthesis